jgi:alpha-D-xyloside xylohydrolase
VLRFFTKLKCRLMPYLWSAAVQAHREGIPTMRAMMLEFPGDPACDTLCRQYLLGGSLLVAPVFTEDGTVDFYLPAGPWTHLLTGEVREGGRWYRERHDYLSLPLYVRPGSIIAFGADDTRPDYEYARGATFRLYGLADGESAECRVHDRKGELVATVTARRSGAAVAFTVDGTLPGATFALAGGASAGLPNGSRSVVVPIP